MAELMDIYNANLKHQGVMDRIQAHMEGKWHRTFHCWVVSNAEEGSVLFQKRSDTMRNYPGLLDVSAAGHLVAGETIEEGVREVTEELGIVIQDDQLHYLGERVEVMDQANGQRNREYQSVYLYRSDLPLAQYQAQKEEVAALVWMPIRVGMQLMQGQISSLDLRGYSYEISTAQAWAPFTMSVTRDSFIPRIQRYYTTAMIMAERLLANAGPLAIS